MKSIYFILAFLVYVDAMNVTTCYYRASKKSKSISLSFSNSTKSRKKSMKSEGVSTKKSKSTKSAKNNTFD